MKTKGATVKSWIIRARVELIQHVVVEAESAAKAIEVFNRGEWEHAGTGDEVVDWEATGKPKLL